MKAIYLRFLGKHISIQFPCLLPASVEGPSYDELDESTVKKQPIRFQTWIPNCVLVFARESIEQLLRKSNKLFDMKNQSRKIVLLGNELEGVQRKSCTNLEFELDRSPMLYASPIYARRESEAGSSQTMWGVFWAGNTLNCRHILDEPQLPSDVMELFITSMC